MIYLFHIGLKNWMKLGINTGIMQRIRSSLLFEAMRSLYYALIHSHLMFSSLVYLNTFSSHIAPLQRQLNKALRVLKSYLPSPKLYPAKSSAGSLYCFFNILPLRHFVTVESILFKMKYDRGSVDRGYDRGP